MPRRRLAAGLEELRRLEGNSVRARTEDKCHWLEGLRFGMRFSLSLPFWGSCFENSLS